MVIGIVTNLFQVVVLTGNAEALLRIGHPSDLGGPVPKEKVLELVHPGIGKHQRWIVLNYHRCRRYDLVALFCKKVEKSIANFF